MSADDRVCTLPWGHEQDLRAQLAALTAERDAKRAARECALVRDCAVVERCDGIVLVGGVISSGMEREAWHAKSLGKEVISFVRLGPEPPRSER